MDQISFIKACQDFFTRPPFGKRIEIPEFKALTQQDKHELREMLIGEGYNVAPLTDPAQHGAAA
jgi:hypothetical protein